MLSVECSGSATPRDWLLGCLPKRQGAGALQDAARGSWAIGFRDSVLECGGPPPLSPHPALGCQIPTGGLFDSFVGNLMINAVIDGLLVNFGSWEAFFDTPLTIFLHHEVVRPSCKMTLRCDKVTLQSNIIVLQSRKVVMSCRKTTLSHRKVILQSNKVALQSAETIGRCLATIPRHRKVISQSRETISQDWILIS